MCKEIPHLLTKIKPISFHIHHPGERKQDSKDQSHSHHDDQEEATHGHQPHAHHAHDQEHHLHDDIVSLAHRSHDHKHPIHLQPGSANFRQNACHAGDGHNHGGESNGPMMGMSFGLKQPQSGGHQHTEDEHAHCPNCDDHMEGDSCNSCGYHEHHD